jgi:hypothetical protein
MTIALLSLTDAHCRCSYWYTPVPESPIYSSFSLPNQLSLPIPAKNQVQSVTAEMVRLIESTGVRSKHDFWNITLPSESTGVKGRARLWGCHSTGLINRRITRKANTHLYNIHGRRDVDLVRKLIRMDLKSGIGMGPEGLRRSFQA